MRLKLPVIYTTIFGLLWIFLGIHSLIFWKKECKKAEDMHDWQICKGRIIASCVRYGGPNGDDALEFLYSYERNGKKQLSSKIGLFGLVERLTTSEKEILSKKYPAGTIVNVYVDPDNTADSVLERGQNEAAERVRNLGYLLIIVGLVIMISLPIFLKINSN